MRWALLGSRSVRLIGGSLIAVVALVVAIEGMLWAAGRRDAERVIVKIERKANESAAIATEVREAVAAPAKRGGRPDPFLRP